MRNSNDRGWWQQSFRSRRARQQIFFPVEAFFFGCRRSAVYLPAGSCKFAMLGKRLVVYCFYFLSFSENAFMFQQSSNGFMKGRLSIAMVASWRRNCPNFSSAPTVPILCSGENFTIVSKPGGVPCHASDYVGRRNRLSIGGPDDEVVPLLQRVRRTVNARVNLVHRLDQGASGCVLCALSDHDTATTVLHAALGSTKARKTYVAIVRGEGVLRGENLHSKGWFTIDRPIKDERGRLHNATTEFLFVAGQPSPAIIAFDSTSQFDTRCSIVLARPHTGRWHQIRRHLNGLSHPILGDSTHGNSRTNRAWRTHGGLSNARLCLHLARMELPPTLVTGGAAEEGAETEESGVSTEDDEGYIDARCPLPGDMHQLLQDHAPGLLTMATRAILEYEAGLRI
jgi:tRNA pseudouridine65 synthase